MALYGMRTSEEGRENAKGIADYYRNERDKFRERVYAANRRILALKGVITKMKKARG